MTLWINGGLQCEADARIAPHDRGLLLGDGLFETIRVVDGIALRMPRHMARLRAGAAVLGIPLSRDDAQLSDAIASVIAVEAVRHGSARLTLTRGPGPRGVLPPAMPAPTVMITASAGAPPVQNVAVIVAAVTVRNERSPLSRIKSLNYLDNILARQEAARHGADEAILLNTRGMVAEAACSNLIVLDADGLVTPPIEDGALGGVARACLIEAGLVRERRVTRHDLQGAEALFLCNSLGVRAVARCDGRAMGARMDILRQLDVAAMR